VFISQLCYAVAPDTWFIIKKKVCFELARFLGWKLRSELHRLPFAQHSFRWLDGEAWTRNNRKIVNEMNWMKWNIIYSDMIITHARARDVSNELFSRNILICFLVIKIYVQSLLNQVANSPNRMSPNVLIYAKVEGCRCIAHVTHHDGLRRGNFHRGHRYLDLIRNV